MIWKQKLNTIPAKADHRSCTETTFTLRTPARKTVRLAQIASQEDSISKHLPAVIQKNLPIF